MKQEILADEKGNTYFIKNGQKIQCVKVSDNPRGKKKLEEELIEGKEGFDCNGYYIVINGQKVYNKGEFKDYFDNELSEFLENSE